MNKIKELGQVYTPNASTKLIIQMMGIEKAGDSTILEPSAGDGAMLEVLLDYLGEESFYKRVTAIEIDPANVKILKQKFPKLRVVEADTLKADIGKFDYIIGNPPYVSITNIEPSYRSFILKTFKECRGRFDLYQAFYSKCYKSLSPKGVMGFIAPNAWFSNASGKGLRSLFEEEKAVKSFYDYGSEKVFKNADTYVAIVILEKGANGKTPWVKRKPIHKNESQIQNGISTNKDSVFISDEFSDLEDTFIKDAYKASTGEFKKIIYPYDCNGNVVEWEILKEKSPKLSRYLEERKEELLNRDLKKMRWYEFARSQGIKNMHNRKLAISTITKSGESLKIKELNKDVVVYSGLYAVGDLKTLSSELNSDDFKAYLKTFGGDKSGGYKTANTTLINNY